ncbi:hypothetical protein LCGC14_1952810 [marine sediment metagenome]|uniref:Uncharacterized protein n=1 Tax=marine sediment metagenome TaxID=412755 RepID=A0A0F9FH69_9ZZZZ
MVSYVIDLILFLGALGLLYITLRFYSLLPNPRMKGLFLLIIGSVLTSVGLYFTRHLLLNPIIIRSKSYSIYWTNILTIIGLLIIAYGIRQIVKKMNLNLVNYLNAEYSKTKDVLATQSNSDKKEGQSKITSDNQSQKFPPISELLKKLSIPNY